MLFLVLNNYGSLATIIVSDRPLSLL